MTHSEFNNICRTISILVGNQSNWLTPDMNTDERMKTRAAHDMLCESMLLKAENNIAGASALSCYSDKFCISGTTALYKRWNYYRAAGMLYVDNQLVLQAAPIPQIFEYLINH